MIDAWLTGHLIAVWLVNVLLGGDCWIVSHDGGSWLQLLCSL